MRPRRSRRALRIGTIAPGSCRCATPMRSRFDPATMPLETRVERETDSADLARAGERRGVQRRAVRGALGQAAARLMRDAGLDAHYDLYLKKFPFASCRREVTGDRPPRGRCGSRVHRCAVAGRALPMVWRCGARWCSVRMTIGWTASPAADKPALKALVKLFAEGCSRQRRAACSRSRTRRKIRPGCRIIWSTSSQWRRSQRTQERIADAARRAILRRAIWTGTRSTLS